jgi:aspartate/methionine/tyrosine aminotransferase
MPATAPSERATPSLQERGLPALRQEIADQYRQLHGVVLDPGAEVVVTALRSQALYLAILRLLTLVTRP